MVTKLYIKNYKKLRKINFTKLNIHHNYHAESEINFTTPEYLKTSENQAIDIRVTSDLFKKVGGVVRERESESNDLKEYGGFSYDSFLRGTFWKNFKGKTTKYIFKWIAKKFKFKTTTIFNAKKKHKKLVFKGDTTGMIALRQVCALDNERLRPYTTYNKKLGLKYVKNLNTGFVIHVDEYLGSTEKLDLNDLVNHVIIYTKKGKVKKQYKNKKSILEFGDLTEILQYPEKPEKGSSDVQDIYDESKKTWYEKSKANYKITVELPLVEMYKNLEVGYNIVFKSAEKSEVTNKKLWIQEIEIIVHEKKLILTLYDRKPYLLDDWRYRDPDGKKVNRTQKKYGTSSFKNTNNVVSSPTLVNKASNCQYCNKGLTSNNVSYVNKCPACKTVKKLLYKNNTFSCPVCGVSYCAKCGSELRTPKRYTLTRGTKSGKPSGVSNALYEKALALWTYGPLQIAYFVCSFTYLFYAGDQETVNQTFNDHTGNCQDLTDLLIAMYKCVNLTGKGTSTSVVINGKKYAHTNMKIKINGITYIIDPSCDGKKLKPANMNQGKFIGR